MKELGTQRAVALRVGKDRATVANAIRLLKLPEFVRTEMREGRISAGHAKAMLGLPEAELRTALEAILGNSLNVRATERLVTRLKSGNQQPQTPRGQKWLNRLADELTRSLGVRIRIKRATTRPGKGRMVFYYSSHEELETIVAKLR